MCLVIYNVFVVKVFVCVNGYECFLIFCGVNLNILFVCLYFVIFSFVKMYFGIFSFVVRVLE